MNFDKWISTANAFIRSVARRLGNEGDVERAKRVTRVVLHALRARLTPEQSMHLIAQLPMLLKAVYVDGWRMADSPDRSIRDEADFIGEMLLQDGLYASRDFPDRVSARRAMIAVFIELAAHVSTGEVRDVERELPHRLRDLFAEATQPRVA